jgi:hypothetical protein
MIVWLASYPRSGNTLLRTVLKRCMDLDSYADEPIAVESPLRSDNALIGHLELPAPWSEFYAKARRSPERILVKTHLPPRDDAPFIYVVRDGRSAVKSYVKYYEQYVPGHAVNLFRLIAGDDAYGDWTSHYEAWNGRPRANGLVVRFEELVDASDDLLRRLAAFLGQERPVVPWRNPLEELAQAEPGFFRGGGRHFEGRDDWPQLVDDCFHFFHGAQMARLGYSPPGPRELVRRNGQLMGTCDERLALIERLHREAQERLDIINALSAQRQAG